ncbi:GNAT family N-acetyltransferase [Trabulsiella odontotermitis]|uniref:GNAT family N-acetyltransferase n=1 Tax=Trabulsiella odontotermitis TaxID=379893 RepID=UPI00067636B0|nr:GNAT family N-acetyltransferase [Trabulsiella odontotermitis]KNC90469.1 GCN5 family acetyltransferase [Trabulsiella odontotermitis]
MATITTPRLILSPFRPADWNFFRTLSEDATVMRYIGSLAAEKDNRLLFATRLNAPHTFVVRTHDDPTALGDIGLRISPQHRDEADIGYMFIPQAHGKGIASEAVRALCEYAFTQAGVNALNAWVLAENTGSVRVLEKCGFVRTQMLEKAYEIDGVHYDDWAYRLESTAC